MTLFVISLINSDDEADDTYSESESEDGNDDTLEQEYDDDKEDILDDLEYDDVNSEEEGTRISPLIFNFIWEKLMRLKRAKKINNGF